MLIWLEITDWERRLRLLTLMMLLRPPAPSPLTQVGGGVRSRWVVPGHWSPQHVLSTSTATSTSARLLSSHATDQLLSMTLIGFTWMDQLQRPWSISRIVLHIYGHYILVCDEDVVKQVNKSYFENERYVSITTTHVMFSQLLNNFHKENNNNTTQTLSTHHSKQPFMDWVREKCNRPSSRKLRD